MKGKEKEDFDLFLFVFFLPYFCHRAPALAAGGGEVRAVVRWITASNPLQPADGRKAAPAAPSLSH